MYTLFDNSIEKGAT